MSLPFLLRLVGWRETSNLFEKKEVGEDGYEQEIRSVATAFQEGVGPLPSECKRLWRARSLVFLRTSEYNPRHEHKRVICVVPRS